jgi:hypothetical protein
MVNPALNSAPVAPGKGSAPGYTIKLTWLFVSFMFYSVLIMNTNACHVIKFSLIYIMNYLLTYGIKICRILPGFLTLTTSYFDAGNTTTAV